MIPINTTQRTDTRLLDALSSESSSTRLQAALAAGTHPDARFVDTLVARCAIEPDFFVRDMLTWALTRLPSESTVPALLAELGSEVAQARSQALHTLSKIGDAGTWPAITRSLLHDADDEVARSAWRAAVVLVPDGERKSLATDLAAQLGRGDRTMRLSLSRALVALGDEIEPALREGLASADPEVRVHARATERLLRDPDADFDPAVDEAKRIAALGPERTREHDADR
ncbi:HEAT repeat domain-containing protein [Amycolatopsis thailandensis]|uniref:HEAT repeat domain-containing protein n=1 Tax=Amycolatopsis thailandensis TaxID=589330 RepID=UPI00362ABAB7